MNNPIQLHIQTPCHENWDNMHPDDHGRYCSACRKSVIDFTNMPDREILTLLARPGQNICGRLAPDQLHRPIIASSPVGHRRWSGWHWLLAGIFLTSRLSAQTRPPKATTQQQAPASPRIPATIGKIASSAPAAISSLPPAPPVTQDSFPVKTLPTVTVISYGSTTRMGAMGITTCTYVTTSNLFDSLRQKVADSLSALFPPRDLTIYPNPVQRGQAIRLSWQTPPGNYLVALYNSAGQLIRQQSLEVINPSQVDDLDIPSSLAAGIYFIRAIDPTGTTKIVTRKLVVL